MKSVVAPAVRLLRHETRLTSVAVPAFARPISFERPKSLPAIRLSTRCFTSQLPKRLEVHQPSTIPHDEPVTAPQRELPLSCPGCGAPTQQALPEAAGYYTPTRSAVKKYLNPGLGKPTARDEDVAFSKALENASPEVLKQLGLENESLGKARSCNLAMAALTKNSETEDCCGSRVPYSHL
jgi:genetic interactor of prohibitins 3, mitochondrial